MDILIPEVGESVREALLAQWFKKNGEYVAKDDPLCELETDKITLDINANSSGILTILVEAGTTLAISSKIGFITEHSDDSTPATCISSESYDTKTHETDSFQAVSSPSIRQAMREQQIDPKTVTPTGKGGRITLDDLFSRIEQKSRPLPEQISEPVIDTTTYTPFASNTMTPIFPTTSNGTVFQQTTAHPTTVHTEESTHYGIETQDKREERIRLSPIRKRIAERLLAARQQTAMLTTFNEIDMTLVKALREKHRDNFIQSHGAPLGLMPFFVKACCQALRQFPLLNASIDRDQIVYHHFYDIGIAIGAEKGLVVPVLRNADRLRLFEIDAAITAFGKKITTNQLSITDLEGGTFTISNGGVYGSILSTPILNPPQSGVIGMHAIQERAVVRDGQIVIRSMMNVALSYDHRLVDGREAVSFLKKLKEYVENPEELLLEG